MATVLVCYGAVALIAALVALSVWPFCSRRRLPVQRLRPGEWTGVDVTLILFWSFWLPGLIVGAVDAFGFFYIVRDFAPEIGELSLERKSIWSAPLNFFLVMAMSSFILYIAHRTRWQDVGLTRSRWADNVFLGCAGYVLVTLPVYLLFLAARWVLESNPHALEKIARQNLISAEWILLVLAAVVLAPIQEEWIFRGVLQGWLRRASALGQYLFIGITLTIGVMSSITVQGEPRLQDGEGELRVTGTDVRIHWDRLAYTGVLASIYAAGVWVIWQPVRRQGLAYFFNDSSGADETLKGQEVHLLPLNKLPFQGRTWHRWQYRNAQWSVVGSSMLFALVHMSNWPAPIPLFVLALVLGWLALRTQSLLPSIVLHMLFNLVATLSLFWE